MDTFLFLLYHFYMENLSEKLPNEFQNRMKKELGEDFDKYIDALNRPSVRGVRVNTKKISAEKCKEIFERESYE